MYRVRVSEVKGSSLVGRYDARRTTHAPSLATHIRINAIHPLHQLEMTMIMQQTLYDLELCLAIASVVGS